MSLRAHIYGFQLEAWIALFGCRDESRVPRSLSGSTVEGTPAGKLEFRDIVRRAITDGVPFPDLAVETDAHSLAAHALASEQPLLETGSSLYPVRAFSALGDAFPELRRLRAYHVFLDGRPVFAPESNSSWNSYGFLSRAELAPLAERLSAIAARIPPKPDPRPAETVPDELAALILGVTTEGELDDALKRLIPYADSGVALAFRATEAFKARTGIRAVKGIKDYQRTLNLDRAGQDPHASSRSFIADVRGYFSRILEQDMDLWYFTD